MPKRSRRHSTARDAYWFTVEQSGERSNLEMLWLRVIEQAWRDCHDLENTDTYKARDAEDALIWVAEANADFDAVCGLASIDGREFRKRVSISVNAKYQRHKLLGVFARHFNWGGKRISEKEYQMPLQFLQEGSGTPYVRYSVDENEWSQSLAEGGMSPLEYPLDVVMDIENIQLGWLKLEGGRDWQPWPNNDPTQISKPTDLHRQGFSVKMFSTKVFGDQPVREFCANGAGVNMFIKEVYDACEAAFKGEQKGKVPAIRITKAPKSLKIGKGTTKVPAFEVMTWVERPSELDGASQPSNAPAKETTSSDGAADDVSFAI